ncbi:hypothetical protein FFI89_011790 [Bradyrhizobium sp. KBS0727]|uniref:DUF5681 domain-containing protein n=1 Tax=unclassified Bradyrhizobium TaxID=2631580 RepID=UPI00110E2D9C|nr:MULTISPECIES: DUF5681 domain-containing protein [unclassified Bradyrhizobium]QDW37776.1 hypothetical protein FFI71_011785 [Bradyrhizobium sp. KBS0725]QDW44380.1 hypothetical protein FFI89_011790 [Bradyrhizobium sp. KBS0727]
MAADNGKRKRRRVVRLRLEDDDEDVGYGKPPRRHQFKPGQSGNPKGRKKGVKNEITILQELLQHKVVLNERGKTRKIILLEAILRKIAEDCLRGNIKSVGFLLNRYYAAAAGNAAQADLSEDDKEVLDAYLRDFKKPSEDGGGQP